MVIVSVLGLGRLGGNIAGDLVRKIFSFSSLDLWHLKGIDNFLLVIGHLNVTRQYRKHVKAPTLLKAYKLQLPKITDKPFWWGICYVIQAFHGHTVRGWDVKPEALDKVHERLTYEKKKLKEDGLMVRPDFLVRLHLAMLETLLYNWTRCFNCN